VTSRGNRREPIFWNEADRAEWLDVLEIACGRSNWRIHAWCQMGNHYHLLVETVEANLSHGMRYLNSVFSQRTNRLHGRTGHVLQGRFHAVLIEREAHLLELTRYIVLNPVRGAIVERPEDWPWSSYRSMIGAAIAPRWLERQWTLSQFGERPEDAVARYLRFVEAGVGMASPLSEPGNVLGSEAFVDDAHRQARNESQRSDSDEFPPRHRPGGVKTRLTLTQYEAIGFDRREAMARAYLSGDHTMVAIARHFGRHRSTVSIAVKRFEARIQAERDAAVQCTPTGKVGSSRSTA
jgi:REP element-mobilizing transposase RayT